MATTKAKARRKPSALVENIKTIIYAGLIAIVGVLYWLKALPPAILFWAAYVLTRPLGATLGDTLTKPHVQGGLNLDRIAATAVIGAAMVVLVLLSPKLRRPATAVSAQNPT